MALDVGILFYGALTGLRVRFVVGPLFLVAMLSFQLSLLFYLRDLLSKHCISDLGMLKSRSQRRRLIFGRQCHLGCGG